MITKSTYTMKEKLMSKYVVYAREPGEGWIPVSWAPTFDTEQEANDWINDPNRDWDDIHVSAIEKEDN